MFEESADELNALIEKVMQNIVKEEKQSSDTKCCKHGIEPLAEVFVANSIDELVRLLNLCKLSFVLITSTTCPYCYMFKPIFTKVARAFRGKAMFVEVNADYSPEIALALDVYSTPTTVVFLDKRPIDMLIGYTSFNSFSKYVRDLLCSVGCVCA